MHSLLQEGMLGYAVKDTCCALYAWLMPRLLLRELLMPIQSMLFGLVLIQPHARRRNVCV